MVFVCPDILFPNTDTMTDRSQFRERIEQELIVSYFVCVHHVWQTEDVEAKCYK
jgi:hypothetical protein